METITTIVYPLIPTVVTAVMQAVVAIVGAFTVRFVMKLIKKTNIEIDEKMMQEIEDIILKAVSTTNQTLTDNYKDASPDHKLTPEQAEEVFNHTKDIIMASLNSEQTKALTLKYGTDVDEAIKMLIENTVYWTHTV